MENATNETTNTETQGTELSPDAIAQALAATRSKAAGETTGTATAEKPKRVKMTDEERAAKEAQKKAEQAARKALRDQERAQNKAKREAERASKIAHMSKVDKAAKNLPLLSGDATDMVNSIMADFDASDITSIIAHLSHRQRAAATTNALSAKLTVGQTVRIVSAEGASARYVGQLATVQVVQRIRCYVNPVGSPSSKRVYLFNSDVVAVSDDELETLSSSDGTGESSAVAV